MADKAISGCFSIGVPMTSSLATRNNFDLNGDGMTSDKEKAVFDQLDSNKNGVLAEDDQPADAQASYKAIEAVHQAGKLYVDRFNAVTKKPDGSDTNLATVRRHFHSEMAFNAFSLVAALSPPSMAQRRKDACHNLNQIAPVRGYAEPMPKACELLK